jgi:hypothetical protein
VCPRAFLPVYRKEDSISYNLPVVFLSWLDYSDPVGRFGCYIGGISCWGVG